MTRRLRRARASLQLRAHPTRRALLTSIIVLALFASLLPATTGFGSAQAADNGLFPWQIDDDGPAGAAPIGTGFVLDQSDLVFILQQIEIAEAHAQTATAIDPCGTLIGPGPNQIPAGPNAELLPLGLRTVSGICNNLIVGQEGHGAVDREFTRLTAPFFRPADVATLPAIADFNGPAFPNLGDPTSYTQTTGWVEDSAPRIITNLIVDQTTANPAAVAAAGPGAIPGDLNGDGIMPNPPWQPPEPLAHPLEEWDCTGARRCEELFIANVAPDEGLSAPFNSLFTFFGQFFDHGLDLTTKSGDLVYMPLQEDDPLFDPAPGAPNFMLISRVIDGATAPVNRTTPFVDQQQTYGNHSSQQVFLREYELDLGGDPVSTGNLITNPSGAGMASWMDLKAQAATLLGIQLTDFDIHSVPLLATDLYGRFIPGPNGYPSLVLDDGSLLEGDPTANGGLGVAVPNGLPAGTGNAVPTEHVFVLDIAHHAAPGTCDHDNDNGAVTPEIPQTADSDPGTVDDLDPCTYDDEMLAAHYVAGDGRVNENIALTSVHHVFHSEHNRLVQHVKDQVTTLSAGAMLPDWQLSPGVWDGERIFQAARLATEMQYQHLAFEEFARRVQPAINVFDVYDPSINAAITAEFAHAVYRFGHSMLTETVDRYDTTTGAPNHVFLLDAFLNPPSWNLNGTLTADEAAGGILAGAVAQQAQEIDEFVTEALSNELLGLPLDLAAINLARGRDAGIAPLNRARRELFAQTNSDPAFTPYESWLDFSLALRTPESLVNFIAAYGTHPFLMTHHEGPLVPGTLASRRDAAHVMLNEPNNVFYPADTTDFLSGTGAWASGPGGVTTTGVDDIDLWVGGLAERPEIFGGLLGSTFNYVFELQLERLQDGDRFYYLHRLAGTNLLTTLEGNSFAELIERNTTAEMLPADAFSVPTFSFDLEIVNPGGIADPLVDDPATPYDETVLLTKEPDGTVRYTGADHVLFSARSIADDVQSGEGDDTVRGHDGPDRLEGGGGNDAVIGGAGNDIITDSFGDDDLKGGPGNDAIHGGPGINLLQGGDDHDLVVNGSDLGELLLGNGNDFALGGASTDEIFAGFGDDWVEGGGQSDLLIGDNGAPFGDNPLGADGHDVLDGGFGDDHYDGESGDDIFLGGDGVERYEGMFDYDWVTHRGNSQPAVSSLLDTIAVPVIVAGLRERYGEVEALSGWIHDDQLSGDHRGVNGPQECLELLVCGPLLNNTLDAAGIARISGLADLLPVGTVLWDQGNILLGGPGSDILEGRGANDILDGDRWLNVQLMAPDPAGAPGATQLVDGLTDLQADIFAGLIDPGAISIVRSIELGAPGTDVDVAVFNGPISEYNVVDLGGGVWLVDHVRGCGDPAGRQDCFDQPSGEPGEDDGTDILHNMEIIRFTDQDFDVSVPLGTGELRVTTTPAAPAQITLDGYPADSWGLTWVDVPQGVHTVCFTDVPALTTPPCQTVGVSAGSTTVLDGPYAPRGWLRVQTSPALPATIVVDGEAMNDWGLWTHLPEGPVDVCFGPIAGFDPPPCQVANISAAAQVDIVGTYTANPAAPGPVGLGFLRVTASPAVPTLVSIDGTTTDVWGLNWVKLVPGTYTVCFGDVQGFTTPACEDVIILGGVTSTVVGNFTERGTLQVNTSPPQPSTISIDNLPRDKFGVWTDLEPGTYNVCFSEVSGITPPCQDAIVTAGANTIITGAWP